MSASVVRVYFHFAASGILINAIFAARYFNLSAVDQQAGIAVTVEAIRIAISNNFTAVHGHICSITSIILLPNTAVPSRTLQLAAVYDYGIFLYRVQTIASFRLYVSVVV